MSSNNHQEPDFLSRKLKMLYDYWCCSINEGQQIPYKRSLDPVEIPGVLSIMMVLQVHYSDNEQLRLSYRLVGTDVVRHWGKDTTGKFLDEMGGGEFLDYVLGHYQNVCKTKRPDYRQYLVRWGNGTVSNVSRLYLPYCKEDRPDRVSHIVVGQVFIQDQKTIGKTLLEELNQFNMVELNQEDL